MNDKELKQLFPFEYAGGGYFRKITATKEKAEILHGMEAVKYIIEKMEQKYGRN